MIPDPNVNGRILPKTYNSSKDFQDVTEGMVKASSRFMRRYRQRYDLENLDWGQDFLEKCCEAELKKKTLEKMLSYDALELGGCSQTL